MSERPVTSDPSPTGRFPAATALAVIVFSCSLYANFAFAVADPADYRFFPPFKPDFNANFNRHLGAEYFNIARALAAGKGFANPFTDADTGPTAWMPPVFPVILAGLLWAFDDSHEVVMAVVVLLQTFTLVGTGFLVLALTRRAARRVGAAVAASAFLVVLFADFRWYFQFTHDWWLIMLTLDLLVAAACWLRPLRRWWTAAGWGLFGGLCALVNPIVAAVWGAWSLTAASRDRGWPRLAVAVLAAGLVLAPWTVRNYLVFGRLIPVKSNVAYELYQSQCLQPDGLLRLSTFRQHPYASSSRERRDYVALGETAFLEEKRGQFWRAVREDPGDFADRVAARFLGATLWYEPFDRTEAAERPGALWFCRLVHPLPFLGVLVLVFTALRERLDRTRWTAIGVYFLYLLPYIAVSYYDRYAVPLLGAKVLLTVWGLDRLPWPRFRRSAALTAPSRQAASTGRSAVGSAGKKSIPENAAAGTWLSG